MADQDAFDTATRIAAGDEGKTYDHVAITLHWLTVLLVIIQFGLGQTWDWFPRPTRHLMIVTHMSFGIILTVVILARVLWRFVLRHHVRSLELGWVGSPQRWCIIYFTCCLRPRPWLRVPVSVGGQ